MTRDRFFSVALSFVVAIVVPVRAAAPPLDGESLALFRVVEDKDGFVNMRTSPSTAARIDGRVVSGCAVAVEATKNGWKEIEDETGAGRPLFIHQSRLKSVNDWKQVPCVVSTKKKAATVRSGRFKAVVTEVPFDPKSHDVQHPKPGSEAQLTIDGRRVVGTDGGLPDATVKLEVFLNDTPVAVPPEATRDLYQPNLGRSEDFVLLTPGEAAQHALVFLWGSDGAGGYFVVWSFVDGKYVGRAVFTGI
jgi:SH3-like domain-containing protein